MTTDRIYFIESAMLSEKKDFSTKAAALYCQFTSEQQDHLHLLLERLRLKVSCNAVSIRLV